MLDEKLVLMRLSRFSYNRFLSSNLGLPVRWQLGIGGKGIVLG